MHKFHSILAAGVLTIGTVVVIPAVANAATPTFQLPFPCNQTWHGNNNKSNAHEKWEIDFNRGSTLTADLGDTVTASADGTVEIASYQKDNNYGNLVKIRHPGGYYTYYAHLNTMAVEKGEQVARGQSIGTVGNTSSPGNNITPHLHYEVRRGSGYPGNIQQATFDGSRFGYPDANVTSRNCSTPYDPAAVCGNGYKVIDTARLGNTGAVDLLWNDTTQHNCVVTLKFSSVGSPTATSAYLAPSGSPRKTDSGDFKYYAGPVSQKAPTCIRWGGSVGENSYNSDPSDHC